MIFQETAPQMLDGTKRQTRRLVKPGDMASHDERGNIVAVYRNGRLLWRVGRDYAIQLGRGKKAVGRTPPIKAIRRERLQEMALGDVHEELGESNICYTQNELKSPAIDYYFTYLFVGIWNSLHRKPHDWTSDPEVWALEFERP